MLWGCAHTWYPSHRHVARVSVREEGCALKPTPALLPSATFGPSLARSVNTCRGPCCIYKGHTPRKYSRNQVARGLRVDPHTGQQHVRVQCLAAGIFSVIPTQAPSTLETRFATFSCIPGPTTRTTLPASTTAVVNLNLVHTDPSEAGAYTELKERPTPELGRQT